MESFYLKTKFAPPHYGRPLVQREELLDVVAKQQPLTLLIHAPGGYGKTALAAQLRQQSISKNSIAVWLNFDRDDNDPSRFVESVLTAFIESGCDFALDALQLLKPGVSRSIDQVITVFGNDLIATNKEYVLYVDDLQHLNSGDTVNLLAKLLSGLGASLRGVLISRNSSVFSRLKTSTDIKALEITPSQIGFSYDEAAEFLELRLADHKIDSENMRMLFDWTEGWASALDWAANTIGSGQSSQSFREILFDGSGGLVSRFPREIISSLPDGLKTFLLQTCVLDSFNADLAQAVTGEDNCKDIINSLKDDYYFLLPSENERDWVRYHPLFLTALRRELLESYASESDARAKRLRPYLTAGQSETPVYQSVLLTLEKPTFDLYDLHRRAARWYVEAGISEQALKHYLNVNDVSAVADILESSALELLESGKVNTLISWAQKLDQDAYLSRPTLQLYMGWAYTLTCQIEKAQSFIASVEAKSADWQNLRQDDLNALKAAHAIYRDNTNDVHAIEKVWKKSASPFSVAAGCNSIAFAKIVSGKYEQARETVSWVEQKPELKTIFYPYIYRQSVFALSYAAEGKFEDANKIARHALDVAERRHGRRSATACVLMAVLSDGLYEQNKIKELRDLISHRYDVVNDSVYPDALIRAYISGAKTYWALNESTKSLDLLDQLYSYGEEHKHDRVMASSLSEKVRQAIITNQVNRARVLQDRLSGFVEENMELSLDAKGELVLLVTISKIRLNIFLGHQSVAIEEIDKLLSFYAGIRRRRLVARLKLMRATANLKAGKYSEALEDFIETLTIGQNCGLKRSFIDDKLWCQSLLKQFSNSEHLPNVKQKFIEDILSETEGEAENKTSKGHKNAKHVSLSPVNISPKELEVLTYLSQGLPNKRIALALNVSPETIRWHMKNIFSKLEVNTRYDAVSRAQTLGVI